MGSTWKRVGIFSSTGLGICALDSTTGRSAPRTASWRHYCHNIVDLHPRNQYNWKKKPHVGKQQLWFPGHRLVNSGEILVLNNKFDRLRREPHEILCKKEARMCDCHSGNYSENFSPVKYQFFKMFIWPGVIINLLDD